MTPDDYELGEEVEVKVDPNAGVVLAVRMDRELALAFAHEAAQRGISPLELLRRLAQNLAFPATIYADGLSRSVDPLPDLRVTVTG